MILRKSFLYIVCSFISCPAAPDYISEDTSEEYVEFRSKCGGVHGRINELHAEGAPYTITEILPEHDSLKFAMHENNGLEMQNLSFVLDNVPKKQNFMRSLCSALALCKRTPYFGTRTPDGFYNQIVYITDLYTRSENREFDPHDAQILLQLNLKANNTKPRKIELLNISLLYPGLLSWLTNIRETKPDCRYAVIEDIREMVLFGFRRSAMFACRNLHLFCLEWFVDPAMAHDNTHNLLRDLEYRLRSCKPNTRIGQYSLESPEEAFNRVNYLCSEPTFDLTNDSLVIEIETLLYQVLDADLCRELTKTIRRFSQFQLNWNMVNINMSTNEGILSVRLD